MKPPNASFFRKPLFLNFLLFFFPCALAYGLYCFDRNFSQVAVLVFTTLSITLAVRVSLEVVARLHQLLEVKGFEKSNLHRDSLAREPNDLRSEIETRKIIREIVDQSLSHFNNLEKVDHSTMVEEVKAKIAETAANDFLEEVKSTLKKHYDFNSILDHSTASLRRIYNEIEALSNRGNLNLIIGVLIASLGIAFLIYAGIYLNTLGAPDLTILAVQFIPKLTVVVVMELFSYFFLRLYKSNLDEIKYFQNEATNLELRYTALEAAMRSDDVALKSKVIEMLMQTDRNPLMAEGLTTRELESIKQLDSQHKLSPEVFVQIANALRGTK